MEPQTKLEQRITASLDTLSTKQRRLARFVLENRYFVSYASAHEVGQRAGASAATVVRFAQSLGYSGFPSLQVAIRDQLPDELTAVERMQERLASPPAEHDIPQSVFATDIKNIEQTASDLSPERLEGALDAIVAADRIVVVGSGVSAAAALFLTHSLRVIGFDARAALDGGLPLAVEVAQLKRGTSLIAIDLWRYVRSTVEAVRAAREQGARVIAITDSILSPLTQSADHVFEVTTAGAAHSLSPTALISLLNVLIAGLSYRTASQAFEALRRVDVAYRDGNLLIAD